MAREETFSTSKVLSCIENLMPWIAHNCGESVEMQKRNFLKKILNFVFFEKSVVNL
jgi:hypothetical protein